MDDNIGYYPKNSILLFQVIQALTQVMSRKLCLWPESITTHCWGRGRLGASRTRPSSGWRVCVLSRHRRSVRNCKNTSKQRVSCCAPFYQYYFLDLHFAPLNVLVISLTILIVYCQWLYGLRFDVWCWQFFCSRVCVVSGGAPQHGGVVLCPPSLWKSLLYQGECCHDSCS